MDKDVAIVGLGCKVPGADGGDEFWEILENGDNPVTDIERFNVEGYYSKNPNTPGKTYTKKAALIDGFKEFDFRFFGLSKADAERMDPQHKFALEVTFQALENGGFLLDDIKGSNTSVFMGQMNADYREVVSRDVNEVTSNDPIGQSMAILANRISHFFDFRGASIALDTACSSSMVAVHLGAQSIINGDSTMSICGGVNFILSPVLNIGLTKAGMTSPEGVSHSFSNKAYGYGRSEGCCVVILKSLEQAVRDGDKIWGTIVTGINQDGATEKLITKPSGEQQKELITSLYRKHNINVDNIGYIEAHGTGTRIGDPIEVKAIGEALKEIHPPRQQKIYIGSVKSNISHLESAAGTAGLIKLCLCLDKKKIVSSLHCEDGFNEGIPFQEYNLEVPQKVMDWVPPVYGPRVGCLNCFGFGGTNVHAVVTEYGDVSPLIVEPSTEENKQMAVAVSAKDDVSLTKTVDYFRKQLQKNSHILEFKNVALTSTCRRQHFDYRVTFNAGSNKELHSRMEEWMKQGNKASCIERDIHQCWVFCGMGTHWEGMGTELMKIKCFAENMKKVDDIFKQYAQFSIIESLQKDTDFSDPKFGQPILFAIQVSLARLWQYWGLKPDVIVGHSVGEVAAAHIAGQLTLESAVKVIYHRGRLLDLVKGGGMLAVGNVDVDVIKNIVSSYGDRVSIAAYNSPTSCTLSGEKAAILEINALVKAREKEATTHVLDVKAAYHSKFMDPILGEFQAGVEPLEKGEFATKIISSVTGKELSDSECCTGHYWTANMRNTVEFDDAMTSALDAESFNLVLEIGPKPALRNYIKEIGKTMQISTQASVRPNQELATLQQSLGQIFEKGVKINWKNVYENEKFTPVSLPKYQFNKSESFLLLDKAKRFLSGTEDSAMMQHPFLRPSGDDNIMKVLLSPKTAQFVYDHKHEGNILLPGAAYAEIVLSAAYHYLQNHRSLEDLEVQVKFLAPLTLKNEEDEKELKVYIKELGSNLHISVVHGNTELAEGMCRTVTNHDKLTKIDFQNIEDHLEDSFTQEDVYPALISAGFSHGESLRFIQGGYQSDEACLADLKISDQIKMEGSKMALHPSVLDNILQLCILFRKTFRENENVFPTGIDISVRRKIETEMKVYMKLKSRSASTYVYNAVLVDMHGDVIAECQDMTLKVLAKNEPPSGGQETCEYSLVWDEMQTTTENIESDTNKHVLIISDENSAITSNICSNENGKTIQKQAKDLPVYRGHNKASFEEFFQNNTITSAMLRAVVYVPLTMKVGHDTTGTQIEEVSMALCQQQRLLLLLCQKTGMEHIVVTQNAQVSPTGMSRHVDITQAPLWGLVRSYLCEHLSSKVRLIDVQDNESVEIMKRACFSFDEEPEIVLCTGKVYVSLFRKTQKGIKQMTLKKMSLIQGQNVKLLASNEEGTKHCHMRYTNETPTPTEQGQVKVQVSKAIPPVDSLYPETVDEKRQGAEGDIWREANTAYSVIGMEFYGDVINTNGRENVQGQGQNVVVCLPQPIKRIIRVDEIFVISQNRLDRVKDSGVPLWLLVLAFVILKKNCNVKKNTKVFFLTGRKTTMLHMVLKACCDSLGAKVLHFKNDSQIRKDAVIISLQRSHTEFFKIAASLPRESRVLLLIAGNSSHALQKNFWILKDFPNLKCLDTQDVFKPSNLCINLNEALEWINFEEIKPFSAKDTEMYEDISMDTSEIHPSGLIDIPSLDYDGQNVYASEHELFARKACFVIIGVRGLGMEIIETIAANGGGYILCMSRSGLEPSMEKRIKSIEEEWKCIIVYKRADVTSYEQLENSCKEFSQAHPGVQFKGIFFGAAVLEDCSFEKMTEEKFQNAFSPKVVGAWNMHRLSLQMNMDLDYFVLHSSIVSLLGNGGQTNYAAGNAFMDALAHYRGTVGLCGQAINWGALNLGLLESSNKAKLEDFGMFAVETDEIPKLLKRVLVEDKPQVSIAKLSVKRFAGLKYKQRPSNAAKFRECIQGFSLNTATNLTYFDETNVPMEYLVQADVQDAVNAVKKKLASILRDITLIDIAKLQDDQSLLNLGVDSLSSRQLLTKINNYFNIDLPYIKVHSGSTNLESLSHDILTLVRGQGQPRKFNVQPHINSPIRQTELDSNIWDWQHLGFVAFIILYEVPMEIEFWEDIFRQILARHVMLCTRATPGTMGGPPQTIVHDTDTTKLNITKTVDYASLEHVKDALKTVKIFDITKELPFDVHLASTTDGAHVVVLRIVETVTDYHSIMTVIRDIKELLISKLSNEAPPTRQTVLEYGNFLSYRKAKSEFEMDNCLSTYRNILKEKPEPIFKMKILENPIQGLYCDKNAVSKDTYNRALELCQKHELTLFELVHSVYHLFLHVIGQLDTVCCQVTVDTRKDVPEMQYLVGNCTGKLWIPSTLSNKSMSFIHYGQGIAKLIRKCLPYAHFTDVGRIFEEKIDQKNLDMLPTSTLVEMMQLGETQDTTGPRSGGFDSFSPPSYKFRQLHLTFYHDKRAENLSFQLRTNRSYISEEQEALYTRVYAEMLADVCARPDMTIEDYLIKSSCLLGLNDKCTQPGQAM